MRCCGGYGHAACSTGVKDTEGISAIREVTHLGFPHWHNAGDLPAGRPDFSELPEKPDISMISYHLPVIHLINSSSYSIINRGAPYPELLKIEFQIHDALLHNKADILNQSLSYLSQHSEKISSKRKRKNLYGHLEKTNIWVLG